MKKLLIVIDMQHDFIDGFLGSEEAKSTVKPMVDVINSFDGDVVYTRDTHDENYMQSEEAKSFPTIHCLKNTNGWFFVDPIEDLSKGHKIFEKNNFWSNELAQMVKENGYSDITMAGVCTDVCVISNAMLIKKIAPQTTIHIIADCCAGTSVDNHNKSIEEMKNAGMFII